MKIESTANWVIPSGIKASINIFADCSLLGAWLKTPPEPTRRSRSIILTRDSPEVVWSNASEMVLSF